MDTNTLRLRRGEAMRDFDDGNLPQAEAQLTELISEYESASDPWTLGEVASCLQDRATIRRFSNRWQEALDDLARCEKVAMRLPLLPRRMTLPNVYYSRALLLGNPYSDIYSPSAAENAIAEFRKYPGPQWVADSMQADIAFNQREWNKAAALYMSVSGSLKREGWCKESLHAIREQGSALQSHTTGIRRSASCTPPSHFSRKLVLPTYWPAHA